MTLGIVLNCTDGIVVGSDRKTVRDKGVRIQRKTTKINKFSLGPDHPLLCCQAGARTVAQRVLSQIDPDFVEVESGENLSFPTYMNQVVEKNIPQFARNYKTKHGEMPNFRLGMGTIRDDQPVAATVYPTGEFDYDERYTAIGSGSLLAEHFLRDPYAHSLSIEEGRKFVGYIIQRVSQVDSNVEGIDVRSINFDGTVGTLDPTFKTALQSADVFDFDFSMNIDSHMDILDEVAEGFSVEEEVETEVASEELTDEE